MSPVLWPLALFPSSPPLPTLPTSHLHTFSPSDSSFLSCTRGVYQPTSCSLLLASCRYADLLRYFSAFGSPAVDVEYVSYLFLGDYVDRGTHSLEVLVLLLALKILHPGQVHLLRGNHEDEHVNALYGFKEECVTRCAEGLVVWQQVNALFEMMPVAALVDGAVLCLHGGLGLSLHSLDQLKGLPRPAKVDMRATRGVGRMPSSSSSSVAAERSWVPSAMASFSRGDAECTNAHTQAIAAAAPRPASGSAAPASASPSRPHACASSWSAATASSAARTAPSTAPQAISSASWKSSIYSPGAGR